MDKDRIKGKVDDVAGRIKRQTGEWTGDKDLEAEGTKDQIKGKTENVVGKVKDAARDASDKLRRNDVDRDRDDNKRDDAA